MYSSQHDKHIIPEPAWTFTHGDSMLHFALLFFTGQPQMGGAWGSGVNTVVGGTATTWMSTLCCPRVIRSAI